MSDIPTTKNTATSNRVKRVYLIRHGQTNANVSLVCQNPDEELSQAGQEQAFRLAERVKEISFQKIIASDFVRTLQTAQPIRDNAPSIPFETNLLFREERWPQAWVGRSEFDPEVLSFTEGLMDNADDASWRIEDAENTADIHARIVAALEFLASDEAEEILVVTHGNYLKQLIGHILLDSKGTHKEVASFKRTIKTTNTGITVIVFEKGRWRLLTWNDHAHFAE